MSTVEETSELDNGTANSIEPIIQKKADGFF